MIYKIGEPDLTNSYAYDESPVCNYPETVTVTNLPAFVIHNEAASTFTVPSTLDINRVGQYTVTVKSEIYVPDDASQTSFSTFSDQFEITIEIQCIINTYLDTIKVQTINYTLGNPTMTDGTYAFEQSPFCNYPETVSVTNLPSFATHNIGNKDFTVTSTTDKSNVGENLVTIRSELVQPAIGGNAEKTFYVEYQFSIIVHPCSVSTYARQTVAGPITHMIKQPSKTDGTYSFGENPVCDYPETVTVTNLPTFATHNVGSSDFTLDYISDFNLAGEYFVTIRSEICVPDDFTQTTCTTMFDEYQFSIIVENCLVNSYQQTTTVTEIIYNIGDPTLTDGSYAFEETPVCGYPETVTLTNLPTFVTHNEANSDFTISQTNDLNLIGQYTVTIKSEICVPVDEITCNTLEVEYDFLVTMQPCIVNTYDEIIKVPDITYYIGATGLNNIGNYSFDESPICNYEETVTLTGLPSFVTHNEASSDFTLPQTNDLALIGSYPVTIRSEISVPTDYTKSSFNTLFAEYSFTIFVKPCQVT